MTNTSISTFYRKCKQTASELGKPKSCFQVSLWETKTTECQEKQFWDQTASSTATAATGWKWRRSWESGCQCQDEEALEEEDVEVFEANVDRSVDDFRW